MQSRLDTFQKINSLYESGRYQCDLFFYQELSKIAQDLDLFEFLPKIKNNLSIVERVAELTKRHLQILEEDDDEQGALKILHQINQQVKTIDTQQTKHVIEQIKKMQGKSYKQLIIHRIKQTPYKKPYLQACERILNSVHDPEMLLQELTIISIFMNKNHERIQQFADIYKNVLTHGVQELKKFRGNMEFIRKNGEIKGQTKVKNYIYGSYVLHSTLVKINQIYKILVGSSKFGLKLGALKHEIQGENKERIVATKHINCTQYRQSLIDPNTQLPTLCSICLQVPGDHHQCLNTIKMFYRKNGQ